MGSSCTGWLFSSSSKFPGLRYENESHNNKNELLYSNFFFLLIIIIILLIADVTTFFSRSLARLLLLFFNNCFSFFSQLFAFLAWYFFILFFGTFFFLLSRVAYYYFNLTLNVIHLVGWKSSSNIYTNAHKDFKDYHKNALLEKKTELKVAGWFVIKKMWVVFLSSSFFYKILQILLCLACFLCVAKSNPNII
jgi:hypothetical protein